MDVSIVITAHNEGLLAHKTMLSVLKAAERLRESSVSYEVIVSLDNPDSTTEQYYSRYKSDSRFNVVKNNFGNVGDSRNSAVKNAHGKYVALVDGDDLVSSNWFIEAYKSAVKRDGLFILHPNIQVRFGIDETNNEIWVMGDSLGVELDAMIMVQYNRWSSVFLAPREVFERVTYRRSVNGYGYEDFGFNVDTTAKNILHYVVPETSFYYRRKANGKQLEHINQHTLLPYTELFDFDYAKTWSIPAAHMQKSHTSRVSPRRVASGVVRRLRKSSVIQSLPRGRLFSTMRKAVYERKASNVPKWLTGQWKEMNQIENQLWPTQGNIINLDFHPRSFDQSGPDAVKCGLAYARLVRCLTDKPDYIFSTYDPLGAGGTEKVLFNYIRALSKEHPEWRFAILRAKPTNFPFEIPDNVDFVDFYGITNGMYPYERDILFDRLIIQSEAKRLHCFFNGYANGDYVYNWVRRHKDFLRQNGYKLYISWFMPEFVMPEEKGRIMTFADPYLGEIYDCVTKVLTDNQTVIDKSIANNAFRPDKFSVHRQPMDSLKFVKPQTRDFSGRPMRVLWASRLAYQKRPDIVKAIGKKLDKHDITIDIYGREQNYQGSYFDGVESIRYRGRFNGFNSLPLDEYDVFLYTSQVDGMPNVLLEATVAGLPIVSSDDGGVGELVVNNKSGKLIDLEDIDGYIEALVEIKQNPNLIQKFVSNAQKIVKRDYTWEKFNQAVRRDIG